MNRQLLAQVLAEFKEGLRTQDEVLEAIAREPFREVAGALVDTHRSLRTGFPEVVYGEGKDAELIVDIVRALSEEGHQNILVTRLDASKGGRLTQEWGERLEFDAVARCALLRNVPAENTGRGRILVVSAGSSDAPVAREAVFTARAMGNEVDELVDVGVAGLHRLLSHLDRLRSAQVVVVVAGMEGALASVVGGLVAVPVVAVPTSVGYGASYGGVAALFSMINSCAAGVSVVNIDNGFGAGYVASLINRG